MPIAATANTAAAVVKPTTLPPSRQDHSRSEKANSLNNVGGNACGAGVARCVRDFNGQNGEQRRAYGHARAGAHPRWAATYAALNTDHWSPAARPITSGNKS